MTREILTVPDALEALARTAALVEHFSPSPKARAEDWNAFLAWHAPRFAASHAPAALARRLQSAFHPVAPELRVHTGAPDVPHLPFTREVAFLVHVPSGDAARQYHLRPPREVRVLLEHPDIREVTVPDLPEVGTVNIPFPGFAPHVLTLPGGLHVTLPLVRPASDEQPATQVPPGVASDPTSPGARYASVMRLWGTLHHLYPLWPLVDVDWTRSLREALAAVTDAATPNAFAKVLERLLAPLGDAHVFVRPAHLPRHPQHALPFMPGLVEGRLLAGHAEPGSGLAPGDEVTEIDGEDAWHAFEDGRSRASGTPAVTAYRAAQRLVERDKAGLACLTVRSSAGDVREVRVSTRPGPPPRPEPRPEGLCRLGGGLVYLDWTRLGDDRYDDVLAALSGARGIIVDARGYPTGLPMRLLGHFTDKPLRSPPFLAPVVTLPDRVDTRFKDVSRMWFEPKVPRLTENVAFLIDAHGTQSYAESVLALVEHYRLGTLVGTPTAGANGVVAHLALPTGHLVRWTGYWARKHDGGELFRVGVRPTVPVERTVAGVRAGRDEVLDAAVRLVRDKLAG